MGSHPYTRGGERHYREQLEDSLKADEIRFTEAELAYLTLQDK
ncbi:MULTISPECIES: hypothetical protein [unclassified Paenibacillus]|nr:MULTISPECIES: hypothetical protein [unclassified Paenibacillus]NIK72108.1 hypothetical protein [Paenibacillus sp. BK720]